MQYIPNEFFKGVQNSDKECPLAFITPLGTDKAAMKRIDTVKQWAKGYNSNKPAFKTISNPPLKGFKIIADIKRWSTQNVLWRIEDPRGFQLEISSGNMAYIMSNTVINKNVIEEELQWCRHGSVNVLIPTSSPDYKTYVQTTNAVKVLLKDINVGDTVRMPNEDEGKYLGVYYTVSFGANSKLISSKKVYCIYNEKANSLYTRSSMKDPIVLSKATEVDETDYSDFINKTAQDYYSTFAYIKKAIKINDVAKTLEKVPVTYNSSLKNFYIEKDGTLFNIQHYTNLPSRFNAIKTIIDKDKNTIAYEHERCGYAWEKKQFGVTDKDLVNALELKVTINGKKVTLK